MSYYYAKKCLDVDNEVCSRTNLGKGIIFLLVASRIQLPPYGKDHRDEAGGSADKVGNRLGEKDAICSKPAYGREPQCQWNNDNCLSQQGEEYSLFCFSQCSKCGLSGELQ